MRYFWDFSLWLLLLWRITHIEAQSSSYYKRTYYSGGSPSSASRYYQHSHSHPPLIYSGDLASQETKRKETSSKIYSKKIPFRPYTSEEEDISGEHYPSSAEYSNEAQAYSSNSNENESREIAIGTQIRVQHPVSPPKKSSISSSSYKKHPKLPEASELRGSPPVTKKRAPKYTSYYEPDPFHVVPPPKSSLSTNGGYNVYEDDQDHYATPSRNKAHTYERYKGVASKKQIDKYLEDQQKLLDEAVKNQLLNNPKFKKYLNLEDNDREREIYEPDYPANPPPALRGNFNDSPPYKSNRPRRRPPGHELKRSPKRNPNRKYRSAIVINV